MKQLFTLALIALVALSCSKDDGVAAYSISGTPEITSLEAGYKRVVVTWEINTTMDDAALTNIYWSGGDNSTGQYLTSDTGNSITLEITDLSEGEHTFYAQNATPTSNKYSAPSPSVTIYVYGDSYCSNLAQRTIASIDYLDGDDIEDGAYVTWNSFTNSDGAIGNMLYYRNQSNVDTEFFCSIDDEKSLVADAIVETEVSYSTLYCPAGCLDTLATGSTSGEEFPMSTDGIIRVASIVAMQPYFAMDDVHVILEKGDYRVTAADINAGLYWDYNLALKVLQDDNGEAYTSDAYHHSIFLIAGDNSIYDFGGSTVTIEAAAYVASGYESFPLHFRGNNNIVRNLTQIDDSPELYVFPNGVNNVTVDGSYNRLEYFTLHSVGSSPYGYGEIFGKGGGATMSLNKHCAVLIRGYYNHVYRCNIYHNGFGHCLYMGGTYYPTVEECYIEGAVSTTEAIYAEKGTGSSADLIDFLTCWGFYMNESYKFTVPLTEEGIRAYNDGPGMVDGKPYYSGTYSPTIIGNTVKNARSGISITQAYGTSTIRDNKVVGCERGIAVNSVTHVDNCQVDIQYGPTYGVDYDSGCYNRVDITVIDSECADSVLVNGVWYKTYNGSGCYAYVRGHDHRVKFKEGRVNDKGSWVRTSIAEMTKSVIPFARFDLGGDIRNLGQIWASELAVEVLDEDGNGTGVFSASNQPMTIIDEELALLDTYFANETDLPVFIDENVSGCHIYSNGIVIIEPGAMNNNIYLGNGAEIYGTYDSSNTVTSADWDIDTCFSL